MVITINGIDKLLGFEFYGRLLTSITREEHFGSPCYVFHFPSIDSGTYLTWEHKFRIYLHRSPKNGSYELFWMGLHARTCQKLDISDIRNFDIFHSYIEKIVLLGKEYWNEN